MTTRIATLFLLLIGGGLLSLPGIAQSPVINEVLSNNETGLQDSDGDYPDWIELYNPGSEPIELLGYTLSDDDGDEPLWVLPGITLPSHGFLMIFASGKDRFDGEELHTNFKLTSEGEWLYLHDPDGNPIDQVGMPALAQDRSFGRSPDGEETWSRLDLPTPGATNNLSNHLEFSHAPSFYLDAFSLEVYSLTDDTVYYTRDGSIPTPHSEIYNGPILLKDRSDEPNVFSEIPTTGHGFLLSYKDWETPSGPVAKANVLRFAAYENGVRSSDVYTRTYFIGSTYERYTLPLISLVSDPGNFFDNDSGIYVPGQHFDSDNPEWTGNYFQRGDAWERDVHISYFPNTGPPAFSQNAGVRIHGGKTRQAAQKSLRIYAREKYGAEYFEYPLLPHRDLLKYERFVLRTTMGAWDGQYVFSDDLAQAVAINLDIETQDARPVIVFLNGEYWGIHVIKDRIDEKYIQYTTGVDEDSVLMRDGYSPQYTALVEFAETHDLSIPSNYASISAMMDLDNFIDYQIAEQFFRNYDWPANNLRAWKKTSIDGQWRWIFFDIDAGFGDPELDMLRHASLNDAEVEYPNPLWSTAIFRALLENDDFSRRFIHRYAEVLNTDFYEDSTLFILEQIRQTYISEIPEHIVRWHYPRSYDGWNSDVEDLVQFVRDRPCITEGHIMDFFDLTYFGFSCLTEPEVNNDILLAPNPNDGTFYLFNTTGEDWKDPTITIYDTQGMAVGQKVLGNLPAGDRVRVNFGAPAQGMYIAQIRSGPRATQIKFVIGQ